MNEAFREIYEKTAAAAGLDGICTAPETVEKLTILADCLEKGARRYNLTAITEPAAVAERHMVDSLLPLKLLTETGALPSDFGQAGSAPVQLCDVGAGAGFPSLPMACVLPGARVLAIDSTAKKIRYILETAAAAGLSNVAGEAGRAETLGHTGLRERFSLVTARAVAPLGVLCEITAPFVKVGGVFAALKGPGWEAEAGGEAARALGLSAVPAVTEYALPSGDRRVLLVYRKERPTPAVYPRDWHVITGARSGPRKP